MKKKQIIPVILAVILGIIIIRNIFSNNTANRSPVSSTAEAQELVEELYPSEKYRISFNGKNSMPSTIFEGKIWKKIEPEDWEGEELVGIYAFGVSNLTGEQGQVWVSDDGGIIEFGVGDHEDGGRLYLIR